MSQGIAAGSAADDPRVSASGGVAASTKGQVSWALFEWARNPYVLLITIYVFAPYFSGDLVGDPVAGQALWGDLSSLGGFVIAFLAPILGAVADLGGRRKPWIAGFAFVLALLTFSLWFAVPDEAMLPLWVIGFIIVANNVLFEFTAVFHNAMLPEICSHKRVGAISGLGLALGNLAGLIMLLFMLWAFALPGVVAPAVALLLLVLAAIAAALWAWTLLLAVPMAAPAVAGGVASGGSFLWRLLVEGRQKRQMHRAFQSYLAPEVLAEVLRDPDALRLGGETRDVTLFFTDLQGFTSLAEHTEPQQLVAFLNDYFTRMCAPVLAQRGIIDKFIGDAIMAVFDEVRGGERPGVRTFDGREVEADAVVVATNSPISDRLALHAKQAPYMSYVIGLELAAGVVPTALYWDTADPYHYVRLQAVAGTADAPAHQLLIVGGEDHHCGQAHDGVLRFTALEAWARGRFPGLGAVRERWSGMVLESIDGLGFIGKDPGGGDHVYVATGDSGMGMTHGTIAGMLIRDLVLGRENPWEGLYEPSRKPLRAAGPFLKGGFEVAREYAGWLAPGEVQSVREIAPGHGALYGRGLGKLAVYRDAAGTLHACSAHCPHLGAPVAWNPVERTWDCTAHGSRFDARGKVINGPANSDLAAAAIEDLK